MIKKSLQLFNKLLMIGVIMLAAAFILLDGVKAFDITSPGQNTLVFYPTASEGPANSMTAQFSITGYSNSISVGLYASGDLISTASVKVTCAGTTVSENIQTAITPESGTQPVFTVEVGDVSKLSSLTNSYFDASSLRIAFAVGNDWYNVYIVQSPDPNNDAFEVNTITIDPLETTSQSIRPYNLNSISGSTTASSVLYGVSASLNNNKNALGSLSTSGNAATFTLAENLTGFTTTSSSNTNYVYATAELSNDNLGCYELPVVIKPIISRLTFSGNNSVYSVGSPNAGINSTVAMAGAAQSGALSVLGTNNSPRLILYYTNNYDTQDTISINPSSNYGLISNVTPYSGHTDYIFIDQLRVQELNNLVNFSSSNEAVATMINTPSALSNVRIGSTPGTASITAYTQMGSNVNGINKKVSTAASPGNTNFSIEIDQTDVPLTGLDFIGGGTPVVYNNQQPQNSVVAFTTIPSYINLPDSATVNATLTSTSDSSVTASAKLTPGSDETALFSGASAITSAFTGVSITPAGIVTLVYDGDPSVNNTGNYTLSLSYSQSGRNLTASAPVTVLSSPDSGMPAVKVSFSNSNTVTLNRNMTTAHLYAELTNLDQGSEISWISSNPDFVTVNQNGLITAVKPTSEDNPVLVYAIVNGIQSNPVTVGVASNVYSLTDLGARMTNVYVSPGSSYRLLSNVMPIPFSGTLPSNNPLDYSYTTGTSSYPIVNGEIQIPANAPSDSFTVTVTYSSGSIALDAFYTITVINPSTATGMTAESSLNMSLNTVGTQNVNATLTPEGTTTQPLSVIYQSSNENIAQVDNYGNVTALANGTAIITSTITSQNPTQVYTANTTVNVTNNVPATGLTVSPTSVALTAAEGENHSATVKAILTPPNTTDTVTWSIADPTIASLSATTGDSVVITALASAGSTTVTAVAGTHTATVAVTVTPVEVETTNIEINPSSLELSLAEGGTAVKTLTAIVTPDDSTQPVTWTSSDTNVATVEADRNTINADVTAVGVGTATITATSGSKSATATVTVVGTGSSDIPTQSITVEPSTVYLTTNNAGKTETQVQATLTPSDSTEAVTWASSSPTVATVESSGNTATITAVAQGETTVTATSGSYSANVQVIVNDNPIVADSIDVTGPSPVSPDYFTVTAKNIQANPAFSDGNSNIQKVSIFCWSGLEQNDMNAKVASRVGDTNDWSYVNFPVNDTPVNNYFYDADEIHINVYASTSSDSDGNLIGSLVYNWVNSQTVSSDDACAYIAYCQDYGFYKPTVTQGMTAGTTGQGKHMEGLRVSSNIPGVEIIASVHAANIGWMQAVPDGEYAGTMGQNRQLEAIRLKLDGPNASNYYLEYSVHAADIGWMDPVSTLTGNPDEIYAGTVGQSRQIEAFTVRILPR